MALSKEEIASLMRLVTLTKDDEIDCEGCLARVAQFAERELVGQSIPVALEAVAHNLSVCVECHEEFEALLRVLASREVRGHS
jgi:hypothetical protein